VCVAIWLTGVLLLALLPTLVQPTASDEAIRMFTRIYHFVDIRVLTPAATLTFLTGLAYSTFTNWGFAKHGWILLKWAVTLLLVIWGTFHLGPSVKALLHWTSGNQSGMAQDPRFIGAMHLGTMAAIINGAFLLLAVAVSVFKPWKNLQKSGKG
jgi:hypothetical protein